MAIICPACGRQYDVTLFQFGKTVRCPCGCIVDARGPRRCSTDRYRPGGEVEFRFYEELNDFLPPECRKVSFTHSFNGRASVKDMIEALGVPHTEVDVILVNGVSVDFSHIVQDGDRISVYPMFESFDVTPLVRLRPRPLRTPKFVADVHLGRLARDLRLLGLDTRYDTTCSDDELTEISVNERRILLTRDRQLLKRRAVTHGYCIRGTHPLEQAREVVKRFDLVRATEPFSRCLRCNGLLGPVDKATVMDELPPRVRECYEDFTRCESCGHVYWPGSHYEVLQDRVRRMLSDV